MKTTPIHQTHRMPARDRIAIASAWMFCAMLVGIALALAGCSFPEEGYPVAGSTYSPPRFPGEMIDSNPPAESGESSEGDGASWGTDGESSESSSIGEGSEEDESTSTSGGSSGEGSSSTTGEPTLCSYPDFACPDGLVCEWGGGVCIEPFEPAPCDASCPESHKQWDMNPGGGSPACYCATPCTDDNECGAHEHCDPFFGACTVACMSGQDCYTLDAVMMCTLWWEDAETYAHFCAYLGGA